MDSLTALLNENLDILKEIGSIGMGHASTSLSQMLNMKVIMSVPAAYIMTADEAISYFKHRSETCWAVRLGLQGAAKGNILQLLSKKFAMRVVNYYFQSDVDACPIPMLPISFNISRFSFNNAVKLSNVITHPLNNF